MSADDEQVDRNYEVFRKLLPRLLQSKPGRYVLMHDGELVDYFETPAAAVTEGLIRFGAGNYSVQQVTSQAENLGFYSYAGGALQA